MAAHGLLLANESVSACLLRLAQLSAAEGVQLRQRRRAGAPVHVRGEQVLAGHGVAARVGLRMRAVPILRDQSRRTELAASDPA